MLLFLTTAEILLLFETKTGFRILGVSSFQHLKNLFETEGAVNIPPGHYVLEPDEAPISLRSGQRVFAQGAHFAFPREAAEQTRWVYFSGVDLKDFHWEGGRFSGYCFDPGRVENPWGPAVSSRGILVKTTEQGDCGNLTFEGLEAEGLCGAVISVWGKHAPGTNREVLNYAENVSVRNCNFHYSGKFMWDYGYLWQILGWPESATPEEICIADQYFPEEFLDREAHWDQTNDRIHVKDPSAWTDVCVFGPEAAEDERGIRRIGNLIHGKQYFVCRKGEDWIQLAETPDGPPLDLGEAGGPIRVIQNLQEAYMGLFSPHGSGPGKGAIDLTACRGIRMTGNRLSAGGDTMHIHSSRDSIISNNHITGSRMGAFFLSEWCGHTTVTGNLVEGTRGSRVLSIEKSNTDCVVTGNTFRGGGRGSWINQPRNLILENNLFLQNTGKCEPDPRLGRRTFLTGGYESWAEMYFTTHEPGASYGPVILRGNLIESGPAAAAAVVFQLGWKDILMEGNQIVGPTREVQWKR